MSTDTRIPVALRRAMTLLADPPAEPDVGRGYLDLLSDAPSADEPATNRGLFQALWASGPGSMAYDTVQGLARRFAGSALTPISWLDLPPGGVAVDVGSGPGNVTAALADAAGADGLALGVDISEAMLARAVRSEASPAVGFIRADAQRLPLREEVADAVVSLAALQLIPDPAAALGEMVRVLRVGGRLAVMVPTVSGTLAERFFRLLPDTGGAHFFTEDEVADILEQHGLSRLRIRRYGPIQWTQGCKHE
ncbi:class I SAM-dependent methyltransferase [Actinocrispum wychmicini]|uniref:class I SAM-dependent methyltransferase n=1 Tax=Actinocrispum wychmicini TaxID=1213861 RepID=UPI001A9E9945|nr:methyltransferase domain-containing protein [Actinocrispum wychmicini]